MTSSSASALFEVPPPVGAIETVRREVKFVLPHGDSGKLLSILSTNCRRVSHGAPTSIVRSLYFDDAVLSACRDNLDGTSRRSKVRIRWYDEPLPHRRAFFEVKRRLEKAVAKRRLALRLLGSFTDVTLRELFHELRAALPGREREVLVHRPEPVLVAEYERHYFEAVDRPMRVTVDTNLKFYAQHPHGRLTRGFATRVPELVILEAKLPLDVDPDLSGLLSPLDPAISRSSKYALGCQYLGLIPGSHFAPT